MSTIGIKTNKQQTPTKHKHKQTNKQTNKQTKNTIWIKNQQDETYRAWTATKNWWTVYFVPSWETFV